MSIVALVASAILCPRLALAVDAPHAEKVIVAKDLVLALELDRKVDYEFETMKGYLSKPLLKQAQEAPDFKIRKNARDVTLVQFSTQKKQIIDEAVKLMAAEYATQFSMVELKYLIEINTNPITKKLGKISSSAPVRKLIKHPQTKAGDLLEHYLAAIKKSSSK